MLRKLSNSASSNLHRPVESSPRASVGVSVYGSIVSVPESVIGASRAIWSVIIVTSPAPEVIAASIVLTPLYVKFTLPPPVSRDPTVISKVSPYAVKLPPFVTTVPFIYISPPSAASSVPKTSASPPVISISPSRTLPVFVSTVKG